MKAILRQTGWVVLFSLGWYALIYAFSLYIVPDGKYVDVDRRKESIYYDIFRIVTYDIYRLQRSDKPKLIILGASNARIGFRPKELQPFFPEYEIANLGTGGANTSDVRQVLELTHTILPRETFQESIFVVGIWYDTFREFWGPDYCTREILARSPFYKVENDSARPILPAPQMDFLIRTLRPFFFLQYLRQRYEFINDLPDVRNPLDRFMKSNREGSRKPVVSSLFDNLHSPLTEEEKKGLLDHYLGHIAEEDNKLVEEKFLELLVICRFVEENGGKLILVDLPLPEWHTQRSFYHHDYQKRKGKYLESALQHSNVRYIDMLNDPELSDELLFRDTTHPFRHATESWSQVLRKRLSSDMNDDVLIW